MQVARFPVGVNTGNNITDILTTIITQRSKMSGGSRWLAAGGSGQSVGAEGSEGCHRRAGGAAGYEVAEAVRKEESTFVDLRSAAEDVHNLARLEPINKVGELDLRQQGLLTDTAFILTAQRELLRPH